MGAKHRLQIAGGVYALNPARAGLASTPAEWPWSSYPALAGVQEAPTFLQLGLAHSLLGGASGYGDFVAAGRQHTQRPGRDLVAVVDPPPSGPPRPKAALTKTVLVRLI